MVDVLYTYIHIQFDEDGSLNDIDNVIWITVTLLTGMS